MKYYLWIFTGIYTLTLLIFGLLVYFIDLSSSVILPLITEVKIEVKQPLEVAFLC
jgi:hypothetical protein